MMEWISIKKELPAEEVPVLCWDGYAQYCAARYMTLHQFWVPSGIGGENIECGEPTHWMPLPAPPVADPS